MNHFSEVTILTSSALYVQQLQLLNEKPKKQTRVIHRDISASEIAPQIFPPQRQQSRQKQQQPEVAPRTGPGQENCSYH